MRITGLASMGCVVLLAAAGGCATGTYANGDDTAADAGKTDGASTNKDSGSGQDSGTAKDSSTGTDSSAGTDSGGNCGGQCSGQTSTCCGTTCVDTNTDPSNCGFCTNACGTSSCCSGSCVDTMGSDNANCGGCGVPCSGTCTNGVCQTSTTCTIDKGTCAHSPCVTGGALGQLCDLTDEGIVLVVCTTNSSCCSSSWDATCVLLAKALETNSCSGC